VIPEDSSMAFSSTQETISSPSGSTSYSITSATESIDTTESEPSSSPTITTESEPFSSSTEEETNSPEPVLIIGAVVGGVVVLIAASLAAYFIVKKRHAYKDTTTTETPLDPRPHDTKEDAQPSDEALPRKTTTILELSDVKILQKIGEGNSPKTTTQFDEF
jgi:hypothetical protein